MESSSTGIYGKLRTGLQRTSAKPAGDVFRKQHAKKLWTDSADKAGSSYRMTDATGIVEHAVFVVPNYPEGYSTDDNARALIVAILLEQIGTVLRREQPTWPRGIWHSLAGFRPNDKEIQKLPELRSAMARVGRLRRQSRPSTLGIGNRTG